MSPAIQRTAKSRRADGQTSEETEGRKDRPRNTKKDGEEEKCTRGTDPKHRKREGADVVTSGDLTKGREKNRTQEARDPCFFNINSVRRGGQQFGAVGEGGEICRQTERRCVLNVERTGRSTSPRNGNTGSLNGVPGIPALSCCANTRRHPPKVTRHVPGQEDAGQDLDTRAHAH
ncbi:hypothetical protein SKAU_G00366830 [Synaphobranchus kaupii]|uniref:Uncharacterized protein n=1 Tax=Synaphobranchus kaupii TaxID=118154 RepID=A0A9Q1EFA0_SYNKA|nr:hypothetical protein SKAU_G00366830 [Synaphobranchus kaupii]